MVLSAVGVHMPEMVLAAIKPLGLSATATALFLTGVILSARKLQINGPVLLSSVTKLLINRLLPGGWCWHWACTVAWPSPLF